MNNDHKVIRSNDEWQCSCGLTWEVGEDDPHQSVELGKLGDD